MVPEPIALTTCPKKVKVTRLCPTPCNPMDCIVHGILQARILEWIAFPFSRGSSQPRDLPRSPALQADSLLAEHKGGRNTEVGSLSLLQQTFLTQESNWGLQHCRQILYQLSYEGSPNTNELIYKTEIDSKTQKTNL